MSVNLTTNQTPHSLTSVLKHLKEMSDAQWSLISVVCTVASLVFVPNGDKTILLLRSNNHKMEMLH